SARTLDYGGLLAEAIRRSASAPPSWRPLIERLATMRSTQAGPDDIREMLRLALADDTGESAALLTGIAKGGKADILADPSLDAERRQLLQQVLNHPREDVRRAS